MHGVNNKHSRGVPIWQTPEFRPTNAIFLENFLLLRNRRGPSPVLRSIPHGIEIAMFPMLMISSTPEKIEIIDPFIVPIEDMPAIANIAKDFMTVRG
jgi:hypothetical protein